MGRRSAVRGTLVAVAVLWVGTLAGLLQNVVAGQTTWWGPLDFLRQHAGWALLGATVLLALLVIMDRFWGTEIERPPTEEEHTNNASHSMDLSSATFNGPVNLVQGDRPVTVASTTTPTAEVATHESSSQQGVRRPVVLYSLSPFLDNGRWEEIVFDVVEAIPSTICAQLDEEHRDVSESVAIVSIFSAAQHAVVKKTTLAKLRQARDCYPLARLILIAAGLSNDVIAESVGHNMIKLAGYAQDQARFLICPTEEDFRSGLSRHVGIVVRAATMQALLDDKYGYPSVAQEE
ncbi:hypothetical protein ACIBO2_49525 [Nonomuraea sp. NPDC050022]|uniref:hypothetical protein n=1 Tax=Nonomuraea sp. NPDC050022 TaxID=3364358 RepID=UPI0037947D4D